MKKRLLTIIPIILCISLCFVSCTAFSEADPDSIEGQAHAYYAIVQKLYEEDTALNRGEYLAVDLCKVKLEDTTAIITLLQDFCDDKGYILLQDDFDGLEEKGYIRDLYFEDGFLITFADIELTESKLVTDAMKWRSGLAAIGAEYTVKKRNGTWTVTETANSWIS